MQKSQYHRGGILFPLVGGQDGLIFKLHKAGVSGQIKVSNNHGCKFWKDPVRKSHIIHEILPE
jgi:hypothetical protein